MFNIKLFNKNILTIYRHHIMSAACRDVLLLAPQPAEEELEMKRITRNNIKDCIGGSFNVDIMTAYMESQEENVEGFVFSKKESGKTVGYVWVMYRGGNEIQYRIRHIDAFIFDLCVMPEHRGQGHSKRILAMTADYLYGEKQIETVSLACRTDNTIALKIYQDLGFSTEHIKTFARFLRINIPYYKL